MITFKSNEDFQLWVFNMDARIESLFKIVPPDLAKQLDFSDTSLIFLEDWILSMYSTIEEILHADNFPALDAIATYVGETFRKNIGGFWDVDFENTKNIYYKMPVITGYSSNATPENPHFLITTAIDRKIGTFIQSVFAVCLEEIEKNKSI